MLPAGRGQPGESGFTLIEVLISTVVLGIIASGVAAAIILFFRTTDDSNNRFALSHDSQLLATYLIPDLDSLTGDVSAGAPCLVQSGTHKCLDPLQTPPSCGIPGYTNDLSLGVGLALQISFTEVNSGNLYTIDYSLGKTEQVITRTFSLNGGPPSEIDVVHNLKAPDEACFSALPSAAPWTMTIGTATGPAGPANPDYTFSVTGGGRVTSPTPVGPPQLCDLSCTVPPLVSLDTRNDGLIDEVVATFDQPLAKVDSTNTSQWQLAGLPASITVASVTVSGNQAILTLVNQGNQPDTVAAGFNITLTPDPNGIRNGTNQEASFTGIPVTDGMAPVLFGPASIASLDTNHDGKMDQLVVTFSEPLADSNNIAQWTLVNPPAGVSITGVKVSGSTAILALHEGVNFDTAPTAGFKVALTADPAGIRDAQGNQSSFLATKVTDQMAPAAVSWVSEDTSGPKGVGPPDGKVDEVVVDFSEPLGPYTAGNAPWTLSGQPPGVTLSTVSVSGSTATLHLNEGTTVDTIAATFKVGLHKPGIASLATGHQSSFPLTLITDGMGPYVTNLTSTNVTGGTLGKLENGDTFTLTFSEALDASSLPQNPNLTLTLTPGTGTSDDMLSIPGVATIDLGQPNNAYVTGSTVMFDATLTSSGARVVTFTVGDITGGTGTVLTAKSPATMTVTPSATLTDALGNAGDGISPIDPPQVLF